LSVEEQQKEIDYWRWQLSAEKLRVNELEGRLAKCEEEHKTLSDIANANIQKKHDLEDRLAEIQQLIEETSIIIADGTQKVRICEFIEKLEKIVKGQEEK